MKLYMRLASAMLTMLLCVLLILSVFAAETKYTVSSGDTLSSIAKKYGVSVNAIKTANRLTKDFIKIGQVLTIPNQTSSSGNTPTSNQPSGSAGSQTSQDVTPDSNSEPQMGKPENPDEAAQAPTSFSAVSVDFLDVMTFQFKDADIRGVLATIGKYSGYKILYLGEPQRVTVSAAVVSPIKAATLVAEAGENLAAIVDNDVIIVGPRAKVRSTFIYEKISTRIVLSNISAKEYVTLIDKLGINHDEITVSDKNPNMLILAAMPKEIAYALYAAKLADKADFCSVNSTGEKTINSKELIFVNIIADRFSKLIEKINLSARIIQKPNSPQSAVFVGSAGAIADIDKLTGYFDVAANKVGTATAAKIGVSLYQPTNISVPQAYEILDGVREIADPMMLTGNASNLVIIGTQNAQDEALSLITTADVEGGQIKASVIARSSDGSAVAKLTTLRDSIAQKTGLSKDKMSIYKPDKVSGSKEYILYMTDTAQNISKALSAAK